MKLIKFSKKTYEEIRGKSICCVERSLSYLKELCLSYDILDSIEWIVDENIRKCGELELSGKKFEVQPLETLKQLNLEKTVILITSDYYREYYDKIEKLLGSQAVEALYFFANLETEYELAYRERYKEEKLQDMIIFRSGPPISEYVKGMDFSDNARALFEYMLAERLNVRYQLIWLVKNPDEFTVYSKYEHVSFLPYEGATSEDKSVRDAYYHALCLAKYIFFTDAYGFVRNCRKDQVRIQLWHGCGYKTRLNFTPCEKRYDFMTVTSELYAEIHAKLFGLRDDQMLITGCPKEDWLFERSTDGFSKLNIPRASKYIFWLPTYRFSEQGKGKPQDGKLNQETGLPMVASQEELRQLNERLKEKGMVLVIKLHPFQDRTAVHCEEYSNIVLLNHQLLVEQDIQINQLLTGADAMISDYSSVTVDYLLLDRPMAFVLEDEEDYASQRGFIFENVRDWLPGMELFSFRDFLLFMEEVADGVDSSMEKRQKLLKIMHKYPGGNSSRRLLQELSII